MDPTVHPILDSDKVDTRNVSFINEIWFVRPVSLIIIETSLLLPIVIFGIFGNFLCVYVLLQNPHIRTPSNLLIGNMAVADLLSLLTHPWVFLSYEFFQNYELGWFGCQTDPAIECAVLIVSVASLSVVSFDRLTAIMLPKETRLTRNGTKIVITITWISGFLLSIPIFLNRTYKEREWKDFLEKYCTEKTLITNIYWHVIITVLVWLPLSIQLICYISIYIKLYKYEKVVLRKLEHHQVNYKKKAVRMMFAVILTFLICRLPFTALIFYRQYLLRNNTLNQSSNQVQNQVNGTYHSLWLASKYLIFVNAALNPLIYGMTNEKFRRGFRSTKLCKWLLPPQTDKPLAVKTKIKEKTLETSLNRNIFFIFKRKQKSITVHVKQSLELHKNKQEI